MSFPLLPRSAPDDVLLVSACYQDGAALWGDLLDGIVGGREGGVLVLGDGGVRLRLVEGEEWDGLYGGNVPAIVPDGEPAPVAVLADTSVVYGGDGPLLVDLAAVPGRGVRVPPERLGEILAGLRGGSLTFGDLVRRMDIYGMYEGDAGRPAFAVAAAPVRRSFPALPPAGDGALLVRTSFDDEEGWHALLDELGDVDENGWIGADIDPDDVNNDNFPLTALVVDDRAYEGLLPCEVPALVAPQEDTEEETVVVVLAGAESFTAPGRPLTAVDLYDIPGHVAVLPSRAMGTMCCNLAIANMDFYEFVAEEGAEPWWEE